MNSRTRFLITATFVCHLLLAPRLVTTQLLAMAENTGTSAITAPSVPNREEVTIRALEQEKDGPVYKLRGQAEVHYRTYVLYADEMSYNSDSGDVRADGHVVLDGGPNDEHVQGSHATYNIHSENGTFLDVVGTIGVKLRAKRAILTSPNPFAFSGKKVVKAGPDHYLVYDGTITTCQLPHPKWQFFAHEVKVEVGGNATIYQSTFRLGGIPIFYFPFATHPIERIPRQSGFLIPSVGRSSTKGTILGDSVYWAMSRSMDATVGAEYYSMRGWSQRGEFRARPAENSFVDLNYFGVVDRGIGNPVMKQGGEDVRLSAQSKFRNFRAVADLEYLSSFVFRLAFYDTFTQAVNSEVKSQAFLSNATNGYFYNAVVQRYQNFESTNTGDVITILHAPSFESYGDDHRIAHSPFYWSYAASAGGLSRSEPNFRTGTLVGRFDLQPSLSLPLVLRGWSVRPQVALRETYYTEQLQQANGSGDAVNDPINRKALETSVEIRPPAVDRVFNGEFASRKWKHVLEPRMVYRYVTGVDNFQHILRFDSTDILANTNEIEVGIVNRLYAKKVRPGPEDCETLPMPMLIVGGAQTTQSQIPWERRGEPQARPCKGSSQAREVVTWEIAQKYFFDPTFGGALVPGLRNVFTTTAELTGIAFLTDARRFSPIVSRLRVQTTARTDAEWDLDYDIKKGLINASTALVNYHFGEFTIGGGDTYLRTPGEMLVTNPTSVPQRFNQFRLLFGYGGPEKRGFSGATSVGFDANLGFLQYSTIQASYNWDCCGFNIEYRRFALGSVRNENQYRFTFSLANIGTFGNLRRQERLF